MTDADKLVEQWVLEDFKERAIRSYNHYKDSPFRQGNPGWWNDMVEHRHIALCPSVRFEMGEHGWECGCYSSYTRDDQWMIHGAVKCDHYQKSHSQRASEWDGGLPGLIKELIQMDENNCYYESEEYQDRYGS